MRMVVVMMMPVVETPAMTVTLVLVRIIIVIITAFDRDTYADLQNIAMVGTINRL